MTRRGIEENVRLFILDTRSRFGFTIIDAKFLEESIPNALYQQFAFSLS